MAKIYDRIEQLCQERGITGGKMCNDLNISRSTITELRKGRVTTLKLEKAGIIADYFGITVDELIGNEPKEKAEEHDILNDVDVAFFGGYKELDEEQRQVLRDMVNVMREKRQGE